MIKTSDKYKQKMIILKNKKDNEAQMNDNVNKFLDECRAKIDDVDGVDVIPLKANKNDKYL